MTDHTRTEKIGGDSINFCGLPSRAGNCYDNANKKIITHSIQFFKDNRNYYLNEIQLLNMTYNQLNIHVNRILLRLNMPQEMATYVLTLILNNNDTYQNVFKQKDIRLIIKRKKISINVNKETMVASSGLQLQQAKQSIHEGTPEVLSDCKENGHSQTLSLQKYFISFPIFLGLLAVPFPQQVKHTKKK